MSSSVTAIFPYEHLLSLLHRNWGANIASVARPFDGQYGSNEPQGPCARKDHYVRTVTFKSETFGLEAACQGGESSVPGRRSGVASWSSAFAEMLYCSFTNRCPLEGMMRHNAITSDTRPLLVHEERSLLRRHALDNALSEDCEMTTEAVLTSQQLMGLYLSHFLSTWNSRCYEFAAVNMTFQTLTFAFASSSIQSDNLTLNTRFYSQHQPIQERLLHHRFGMVPERIVQKCLSQIELAVSWPTCPQCYLPPLSAAGQIDIRLDFEHFN